MAKTEDHFCTHCRIDRTHTVTEQEDSIGRKLIMGRCHACNLKRALPQRIGNPENEIIHFGKHKGKSLYEIPIDYLKWLLTKDVGGYTFKQRVKTVIDLRSDQ